MRFGTNTVTTNGGPATTLSNSGGCKWQSTNTTFHNIYSDNTVWATFNAYIKVETTIANTGVNLQTILSF